MSELAVRFEGVGKMYKIFPNRRENLRDALDLPRFRSRKSPKYNEFWALRDIDFELRRGERIGIIGRNGAGKSTLLKIVTGNLPPPEGTADVRGSVQALLEIGGGLHPEFTGRENIHASLSLMGLSGDTISRATVDIAEFTELGRFLDQPFKTYSLGMQARLSLGIATSIEPEILIIDEILGAGDAYFFAKSTARMQGLLEGGASVLLVSHALDQVARFCDETFWLDRGRIVMRGETNEVLKAYERFVRTLDEKRLHAKNRKALAESFDSFARDSYTDKIDFALQVADDCDVQVLELLRDGVLEDSIAVGGAQDADAMQSASIEPSGWGAPQDDEGAYFRKVPAGSRAAGAFHLWFRYPESTYTVRLRYRAPGAVDFEIDNGTGRSVAAKLPPTPNWRVESMELRPDSQIDLASSHSTTSRSRWSGKRELSIEGVELLGSDGVPRTIYRTGSDLICTLEIELGENGTFPLIPAALIFRTDGVVVTRHVGERVELSGVRGTRIHARLELPALLLGNGTYLLSIGLYRHLDIDDVEEPELYDYFDRSFEFQVIGNPRLHNEIVRHPGGWQVEIGTMNVSTAPAIDD